MTAHKAGLAKETHDPESMEFRDIWDRYYRRLYIYLKTSFKVAEMDIEDYLQEIFYKIYHGLHRYDSRRSLSVWVYSIARYHMIDVKRKQQRTPHIVAAPESAIKSPYSEPDTEMVRSELEATIRDFIVGLNPEDSQIAFLRHFEGMKYREINETTGMPIGTLKFRIFTIRKQLSRHLFEQGYPIDEK